MKFDISVVIPCRSHDASIVETITSLNLQIGCSFEVIIVFNPKLIHLQKLETKFPVQFLQCKKGANSARNRGLKQAQSDLVFFMDSDCVIEDPNLLKKYVTHMNEQSQLSGCGGQYQTPKSSSMIVQLYHNIQTEWLYSGLLDQYGNTRHLLGGNFIVRLSKIKGEVFDDKIIFGGTELEFILRLCQKNHKFQLLENQKVIHDTKLTFYSLCKKAYLQGKGLLYTQKKLNTQNTQSLNFYLPHASSYFHQSLIYKSYKFFFNLGYGTWLSQWKCTMLRIVQSSYYRIYFYLNLVKRMK